MKSANYEDYYIEGKLIIKGNVLTIDINKIKFNDYNLKNTMIKNYEYKLFSGSRPLLGVGYNDASNNVVKEFYIFEFQKAFKIYYHDKMLISKEEITNSNLILEFNFVDIDDNVINKKIEILIMTPSDDKSTN